MIELDNGYISVAVDVSPLTHVSDFPPVFKGVLVILGFSLYTADSIFNDDYRELDVKE